jgi:cellulose synthase/poly-beta-1,6-N-acetylglucosamine synthase-like glycosyltransferase
VVVDNCTDGTAEIARRAGAHVLERHDPDRRGKGFALAWAFERILPLGHDALVVLDADCRADADLLRAFARRLADGDPVLHARYVASNPDASPISYALAVANRVEDDLFYAPKDRLGLAVFLRGTGMAFRRDVLERLPWRAVSNVEDAEYTVTLLAHDVAVRFVPETRVVSEYPQHAEQLDVQRRRWTGGGIALARGYAPRLIGSGLVRRSLRLVDAGWTMLIASRPLVLAVQIVAVALGLMCVLLAPGGLSSAILMTGLSALALQAIYLGMGVILLGLSARRVLMLLRAPALVARLILIAATALLGAADRAWARTPRWGE